MRSVALSVALAAALLTVGPPAQAGRPILGPMSATWKAKARWNDALEREYGAFVEQLGRAIEERRCARLDACLSDPLANTTYDEAIDTGLSLAVDCADLPYVLRAYFSFKRKLPFGFVSAVRGEGFDIRYAVNVAPTSWQTWRSYSSPLALLRALSDAVHTGMYRLPADSERGDFYPVRIARGAVGPGAIFYDPLGHVAVVARIADDGDVGLLNGFPDGSITWTRLDASYSIGAPNLGGGFKRFRPQSVAGGRLVRAKNLALPDFDAFMQYDVMQRYVDGEPATFQDWVRAKLALPGVAIEPLLEFRERVRTICSVVVDRAEAVELSRRAGLPARPRLPPLPADLLGSAGDWGAYSTPARDARIRARFRELDDWVRTHPDLPALVPFFAAAWKEEVAAPSCHVVYRDSQENEVTLTLDDVLDRLFDLSFDPYHCPERRWGAPEGSAELSTCPDDEPRRERYEAERRLRYRMDRDGHLSLDFLPETPPEVDLRRHFPDERIEI